MGEPATPRPKRREIVDKLFQQYAIEVGLFLLQWNDLQDKLSDLFVTVVGFPDEPLTRAIWNAIPVDRHQRAMLRSVAMLKYGPPEGTTHLTPKMSESAAILKEIEWILESTDKLGQRRDAAAHSPVAIQLNESFDVVAHHLTGHPGAKSFKDAKLLEELKLYRARAEVLFIHSKAIDQYVQHSRSWTFPKRPVWPERQNQKKGEAPTPTGPAK